MRRRSKASWVAVLSAALALAGLGAPPARAQSANAPPKPAAPAIEAKAISILKVASATLAAARTLSFTAVNTYERAARNGQPLFYSTRNYVTVQRPDKLRVITPGDGTPDEFYYDGKTMTAYVPSEDLAAVAKAPPTIDGLLDAAWDKAAIDFPFADIIVADPLAEMAKTMTSAFYVGQSTVVGGTVTDMVAVASDDVQAEIWIGVADHLPHMVKLIYTHEPARALYETDLSDWRLDIDIPAGTFASDSAAKARPMPFAPPGLGQPAKTQ